MQLFVHVFAHVWTVSKSNIWKNIKWKIHLSSSFQWFQLCSCSAQLLCRRFDYFCFKLNLHCSTLARGREREWEEMENEESMTKSPLVRRRWQLQILEQDFQLSCTIFNEFRYLQIDLKNFNYLFWLEFTFRILNLPWYHHHHRHRSGIDASDRKHFVAFARFPLQPNLFHVRCSRWVSNGNNCTTLRENVAGNRAKITSNAGYALLWWSQWWPSSFICWM